VTIEDLQNTDVLAWREDRLRTMGFDPLRAYEVARTTLDLHELEHCSGEAARRRSPSRSWVSSHMKERYPHVVRIETAGTNSNASCG
jgi:hypothetical protein